MRLIDADELKKHIEDAVKNQKGSDYDLAKVSELPILIDRQKTAYDVDKVVENIEDYRDLIADWALKEVLKIVKKGGINE